MTNKEQPSGESERDILASKEHIYEPKYGGKDHSGYSTMMLYEVNYEREDAFLRGWDAAEEKYKKEIKLLEEAIKYIKKSGYCFNFIDLKLKELAELRGKHE